jgi:hypothetical protein
MLFPFVEINQTMHKNFETNFRPLLLVPQFSTFMCRVNEKAIFIPVPRALVKSAFSRTNEEGCGPVPASNGILRGRSRRTE